VFSFATEMVRGRHRIPVIYHLGAVGSGKTSLLHAWAERAGQLRLLARPRSVSS
jgi:chromosomal replication initiation ATPase DnaA